MTRKRLFMLVFLMFYTAAISLFIVNIYDGKEILYSFLITLPVLIIYMISFVRMFSATFFFLAFYMMLFFVQPLYNLIVEYNYHGYGDDLIKTYALITILSILLFCITHALFSRKTETMGKIHLTKSSVKSVTFLLSFILIMSIALCFIDAGTFNILRMGRIDLKNTTSSLRLVATFGFYTTSILFFLIAFTLKARRRSNVFKWMLVFLMVEVIIFLLFRTRSLLVVHSSAVLVGYYYSNLYVFNKRKSKVSPKFITISLGVIVFISAITTRFFRGFLQPGQSVSNFDFDLKLFLEMSIQSGDIGYATRVFQVLGQVPQHHDFLLGQSYYRLLFTVIPRSIWSDKPRNTEQIVADWLEPSMQGMSIPPGIAGDAYINFGLYGVILFIFFGAFFAILDNRVNIRNFMIWGVSATWIFHLVRGGFTNPLIIFTVLFVVIYLINYKFFGIKFNSQKRGKVPESGKV